MIQTSTWVIIPVKPLDRSKSRLADVLSADARALLTRSLLTHILVTVEQVAAVTQTLVVTRDPEIAALARIHAARVFSEENPLDLNNAVTGAVELARQRGADETLILPSDLPFITPDDVENMLNTQAAVVLCPDRHDAGTNALLLRNVNGFAFQFGPNSFHRHKTEARAHDLETEVVPAPGLLFDLDTTEDWAIYQERIHAEKQTTQL
jgi:2-phospho-L-lactate guanylyltransferase